MSYGLCSSPRLIAGGLLCAVAGLTSFTSAQAGLLGDRFGATVDYLNITEGSVTDPLPLYGSPAPIPPGSDFLSFNPTSFGATAVPAGPSIDVTDGTLSMIVKAHPGETVDKLTISEAGGYSLIGPLSGGGLAQVSAALLVVIDYQAATNVGFVPFTASYSVPSFFSSLPTGAGVLQPWSLSLNLDFDALLPGVDLTQIKVTLNNQLVAQNDGLSAAFIDKKSFVVNTNGDIVPEPATFSLLGIAGFGLMARRRKA